MLQDLRITLGPLLPHGVVVVHYGNKKSYLKHSHGVLSLSGDSLEVKVVPMSFYHTIRDQKKQQSNGFHVYASSGAEYSIENADIHVSSSLTSFEEPTNMICFYDLNPKAEISQPHLWSTKEDTKETNQCSCCSCVQSQSSTGVMTPCGHRNPCFSCGPSQKSCPVCKQAGMWLCVGLAS
jgi:hypothetical protein